MKLKYVLLFPALLSPFAAAQSQNLNMYLWEDTLSQRVIDQWQQEHKATLTTSHFDNDDERSLLMLKGVQLPFDIVVLDNVSAQIYARQGSFIDLSDIPNRQHNSSIWNQACGTHAVPYFWGTVGYVYRKDKVTKPPQTWQEFMHPPASLTQHIGMITDSVETLLPSLYAQGASPFTGSEDKLKQAYEDLKPFNHNVLTYEYVLSYVRSHQSAEELHMALAYSGDHYSLNRSFSGDKWAFARPQGQAFIWVDCLAVSNHSQNKSLAKSFINFLLDPNIAAKNAIDIRAATPNLSALKLLPDYYVNDTSLFLSQDQIDHGLIDAELSNSNIGLRAKIINSIIKRHEAKY
ncbi:polyamine ABC transporter substrate-binding protein [Vibrio proteolyticus]